MDLAKINEYVNSFSLVVNKDTLATHDGKLKVGVDLGTANIAIAVLDENDNPIAGATEAASVVKDGLVVDYLGAIQIVKRLKLQLEDRLKCELKYTSCAVPPGTNAKDARAVKNVCEAADFEVDNIIDEPTAASLVLNITDGAVVDVGGGTTGISILEDGKVIYVADEPTGGTHMSLVIAGHYKISFEEAEKIKLSKKKHKEIYPIIEPVVEKMASIVNRHIKNYDIDTVYVVGGASDFLQFERTFEKELMKTIIKPKEPIYVTPLGIAISSKLKL